MLSVFLLRLAELPVVLAAVSIEDTGPVTVAGRLGGQPMVGGQHGLHYTSEIYQVKYWCKTGGLQDIFCQCSVSLVNWHTKT